MVEEMALAAVSKPRFRRLPDAPGIGLPLWLTMELYSNFRRGIRLCHLSLQPLSEARRSATEHTAKSKAAFVAREFTGH